MSRARLFVERLPAVGESVRLSKEESAHARARRVARGDAVVLFDGSGCLAQARVVRLSRAGVDVSVERIEAPAGPGTPITLLVAAVRAERLSWVAEKGTELSVSRIVLVRTERTQSFRAGDSLRDRLARVAREAAKQGSGTRWPQIEGPMPLDEALAREAATRRLLLDAKGEPFPASLGVESLALAVGPEGGWTPAELESARRSGWIATALPADRLRAETAAVAGLVLARAALARKP